MGEKREQISGGGGEGRSGSPGATGLSGFVELACSDLLTL